MELVKREPVLAQALVGELILLVVAFGLDLSGEQVAAINGLVAALFALWARSKVTPTADSDAVQAAGAKWQ